MTVVNDTEFLERLYEVVYKLASIAKAQTYRFQKIWNVYFASLDIKPHIVRNIPVEKEKFIGDLDYRIKTLKTVQLSFVDGYYSIQSILKAVYENLFDTEMFKKDFTLDDQLLLKYLVARKILGDLVQYNKMDHETVPLKYNIIARDYIMMKLKGLSLEDIFTDLTKLNKIIEKQTLIGIMEEIKEDGIIDIEKKDDDYFYTIKKELILSADGEKLYNSGLRPLVEWPTQLWRSFYNIRELNFTTKSCLYNDALCKILQKSATQGFGPANYVFKNLVKYFEQIKEES